MVSEALTGISGAFQGNSRESQERFRGSKGSSREFQEIRGDLMGTGRSQRRLRDSQEQLRWFQGTQRHFRGSQVSTSGFQGGTSVETTNKRKAFFYNP